jgi:RHS repeat-associated protein
LLSLAGIAAGQVSPGIVSWSAYDSGMYDTINLQSLNVTLNIPVMSKSGAFPFNFNLVGGDSYISTNIVHLGPGTEAAPLVGTANGALGSFSGAEAVGGGGYVQVSYFTHTTGAFCPGGGSTTKYSNWYIQFPDGTLHFLPAADYVLGTGCPTSFTDQVVDGTGYTVSVTGNTSASAYDRGGMVLPGLKDSNGNTITYSASGYTDTMGLGVLSCSPSSVCLSSSSGTITFGWNDVAGGSPAVSETYNNYILQSVFNCSGLIDYDNSYMFGLTNTVTFPDSTSIGMEWEATPGYPANRTGRLSQLTLRTGSTVAYNYNPNNASNDGLNCTYVVPNKITRATSDGTVSYTLSFFQNSGSNYGQTDTKLDIAGNKTVYTFSGLTSTGNAPAPIIQPLTEVQYFVNTGTVTNPGYSSTPTKQVIYCYNSGKSPTVSSCPTAVVSEPVTQLATFSTLGGMSASAENYATYDKYGNVTYSAQYDFGGTTPITATTLTYGSACGSGSTVNDKICTSQTTMNGNVVASSKYTYSAQGNLLTSYISPNGGSTFLSNPTANVYNPNGTIATAYDLAGNATTYGYSSGGYIACGTCTNFPFPTSMATGGLTTYATYYGSGGVKHTHTDASGNVTTYGYTDPWNRVTSIQDPLLNIVYRTYSVTSVGTSSAFGSSVNNTTTTFDGYGRPVNAQTQQGPGSSNYDTVSTAYGFSGGGSPNQAYISTNVPCSEPLSSACPVTNQIFRDMLGRVGWTSTPATGEYVQTQYILQDVLKTLAPAPSGESTKSVQTEYDGLGRPISVCKISPNSVSGSVSCNQKNGSYNGILTDTSYGSSSNGQRWMSSGRGPGGQQTRTKTVDSMGRLVATVTPEGGTTLYFWDAAPPVCYNNQGWPTPGDLGARKDNAGTYICYGYDALHRLVGVLTRPSGPCFGFIYDSATPPAGSGITVQYTAGRIVEAYTNNDCNGTTNVVTDEWFSYDKDGHMTDMWELTPHSTQYYHSAATFAGNGVVTSLQLVSPSLYTMNYTLDGEGRWNKLAQGSSNIVTGPAQMYNAAGQPIEVDLTGSDKDLYTYDPHTGNMTQYEFEVGGANETGVLTWNPNNTLQQLAITDGFNSGGTQTCYFNPTLAPTTGYDDLGRLVGVDCGSGHWGQDFAYDQYDNLTQTTIPSRPGSTWNPGYNSSNNYVMGATYDASGNMTNDGGMNVYGYDQFNKLSWTAGSGTPICGTSGKCITYDAFGRMVEKSNGGAWTEIWYTQVPGSQITMAGTTANSAYWPSPGRGTFVASGSNTFLHQDWLGNDRIVSAVSGHTVSADRAYAPYGEQYNTFGSTNPVYDMFAGITGDFDPGVLFDTPNREFAQYQGRWISPDPAGAGWNQYTYSTNPNSNIDPAGLKPYLYAPDPEGESVQQGTDEFDAIAGAPGTYSGFDMYGNFTWGSSVEQWKAYFATLSVDVAQAVEAQQEALADAISSASNSPDGSNWDEIYEGLRVELDSNGNPIVHGSNAVFSWNGDPDLLDFVPQQAWDTGGCLIACRYGDFDQIHYHGNDFHLDTVGVNWGFGLGAFLHGLIDYGFGNINGSTPRIP